MRQELANLTSIKIGGVAAFFYEPTARAELLSLLEQFPSAVILGGGSNIVFGDLPETPVISLRKFISPLPEIIDRQPNKRDDKNSALIWRIAAGVPLPQLVAWAIKNGLGGIECLIGIPGTLGGAIAMNAGTPRGTISAVVRAVEIFSRRRSDDTENLTTAVKNTPAEQMQFAYRHSILQDEKLVALSAELQFTRENPEILRTRAQEILTTRASVKIKYPNCGSVFRNPPPELTSHSAGALLEQSGLKTVQRGNLRVSPQHANFFENLGGATFTDFCELLAFVQGGVEKQTGIRLTPEVKIIADY